MRHGLRKHILVTGGAGFLGSHGRAFFDNFQDSGYYLTQFRGA